MGCSTPRVVATYEIRLCLYGESDFYLRIIVQVARVKTVSPYMSIDSKQSFEPLWHPTDAGQFLGLHEKTVIKMARNRQLPALRLGKHWRFRCTDLVAWADSQVQSTCQPVE